MQFVCSFYCGVDILLYGVVVSCSVTSRFNSSMVVHNGGRRSYSSVYASLSDATGLANCTTLAWEPITYSSAYRDHSSGTDAMSMRRVADASAYICGARVFEVQLSTVACLPSTWMGRCEATVQSRSVPGMA